MWNFQDQTGWPPQGGSEDVPVPPGSEKPPLVPVGSMASVLELFRFFSMNWFGIILKSTTHY